MQKFKTSMFFKVATAMLLGIAFPWQAHAQRTLTYFLEQARQNSPLIVASQNAKLQRAEDRQRLKALYTHARWELGGDLQFVPIITTDGGKTRFKADAQSADSYAGYDPGQTSSHLNAGIQVTQPLTGARDLRDANNLLQIQDAISDEQMRLTSHDLDRQVTERYLLCLLDLRNEQICHTIDSLLDRQQQTYDYQKSFADTERSSRLRQLRTLMQTQDERIRQTEEQITSYRSLLTDLQKELAAGRRSVLDELKVFRDFRNACNQLEVLKINKQLQINTYNYWNW